jgi:hypothetical protein
MRWVMPKNCARCGADLAPGSIMSRFNTEQICNPCRADEKLAPNYATAEAAELAAVRAGIRYFEGIGLSPEDQAFLAARRAARPKDKVKSQ